MATYFARGIINPNNLTSVRLPASCHQFARSLPEHRSARYIASRALLAELIFMLYGTSKLPELTVDQRGRPCFADPSLADFSIAYAGNIVGVALTPEGRCGLDIAIQRPSQLVRHTAPAESPFSSSENTWINNQRDPQEARLQLETLRGSVNKLTGCMTSAADEIRLFPGAGRLRAKHAPGIEAFCDTEDVLIWAVSATRKIDSLTLWEFDNRHGWRNLPDIQARLRGPGGRIMRFTSMPAEKVLIPD
ncbi:hypothetical protein F9C28_12395 [Shimwellia pseudoproteus]|uniref:4'-phosphopantetheinyl transferase family protein n=1 Tax=Shimwellia pseudoproteus TaxID=570012 RepID=UPI0018EC1961|nr:hypothetical protein [Shimwellia pseudoproteus]MBJ3815704.1 hypothetical protein [Shimwellia pseudoproteus]